MAAVAGLRAATVGSQTLSVGDTAKVPLSHVRREIVSGLTGPAGYSEMPTPAYAELDVVLTAETDIDALFEPGQTVQLDFKSGRSYVFDESVAVGDPPEFAVEGGKFTIRYESGNNQPGRCI